LEEFVVMHARPVRRQRIHHARPSVTRSHLVLAVVLAIAVLAIGCTGDVGVKAGGDADVPVETWVNELCTELGRFAQSSLSPATSIWFDVDAFDEITARFEDLAVRVAALGTPSVTRGEEIAAEIVARLRDSASTLRQVRPYVVRIADGEQPQAADAFLDSVAPAAMYPYALLSVLVSASQGANDVVVYLADPVSAATVATLTDQLLHLPNVSDVEFESKDEACERFKEIFEDQPALVESVDCDELPASLRVKVPDHESGIAIQSALEGESGVDRVIVPELPVNPLTGSGISDAEVERLAPLADAAADQPACQMDAFE
jgi:hypothetical protein